MFPSEPFRSFEPSGTCSLCPAVVALSALDPRGRCPACAPCAVCPLCHEVYQPCDGPCPCHRDGLDPEPSDLDALDALDEAQHLSADASAEDRDAFDLDLSAALDLLDADTDALAEIVLSTMSRAGRKGPGPVRSGRVSPRTEADLFDAAAPWHAEAV